MLLTPTETEELYQRTGAKVMAGEIRWKEAEDLIIEAIAMALVREVVKRAIEEMKKEGENSTKPNQ